MCFPLDKNGDCYTLSLRQNTKHAQYSRVHNRVSTPFPIRIDINLYDVDS